MEKKLDLDKQHKQKETFSVHLKPSLSKHRNDQPNVKEDGFTNLFSEDCNHPVPNSVSGDFKKDFSMPIYDEYEDVVPKKPAIKLRSFSEENMTVIQSQKDEKIEDNECAEGDSLPLCYSSFELTRHRLKASK